jgi:hypothetical protein
VKVRKGVDAGHGQADQAGGDREPEALDAGREDRHQLVGFVQERPDFVEWRKALGLDEPQPETRLSCFLQDDRALGCEVATRLRSFASS